MQDIKLPAPAMEKLLLPSMGLGHGVKELFIRPMTMREERLLTNKTLAKNGKSTDEIIKACIGYGLDKNGNRIEKEQINLGKLFLEDEYAILLFLRSISYGFDYDAEIECPVCKAKRILKVNLETDLSVKYAAEDLPPTITVMLPHSKKKVIMNYPTKEASEGVENPMDVIPKLIVSAEGIDDMILQMWLQNLIARDIAEMRKAVQDVPFGVSKKVNFICENPKCDKVAEGQSLNMPVTAEFFRL